jgi:hypothetical protein
VSGTGQARTRITSRPDTEFIGRTQIHRTAFFATAAPLRLGCTLSGCAASLVIKESRVLRRTVSIVCRDPGRLHGWSRIGPIAADAADGADGIFQRRAYPDSSVSGAAFPTEDNIDPAPRRRYPARVRGFLSQAVPSPVWAAASN